MKPATIYLDEEVSIAWMSCNGLTGEMKRHLVEMGTMRHPDDSDLILAKDYITILFFEEPSTSDFTATTQAVSFITGWLAAKRVRIKEIQFGLEVAK